MSMNKMPDRFKKQVNEAIDRKLNIEGEGGVSEFSKCESPIEQMMFFALSDFFENIEIFDPNLMFSISVQEEIIFRKMKYRSDILIRIFRDGRYGGFYVIECDGHDFHQKTKEQVKKDRIRERNMMKAGYKIVRFTGSEIFEDARSCVIDFWEIASRDLNSN